MDIYTPIVATGNNQDHNRWSCSLIRQPQTDTGHICLVRIDPNGEVVIRSQAEEAELENPPTLFWEVLQKWKQTWMWDNI